MERAYVDSKSCAFVRYLAIEIVTSWLWINGDKMCEQEMIFFDSFGGAWACQNNDRELDKLQERRRAIFGCTLYFS